MNLWCFILGVNMGFRFVSLGSKVAYTGKRVNWASVSKPHTSVFNCKFVCAYSVRTHIPHIVSHFNITFQIVSVIFQIVHVATVAAVQLA